MKKFLDMNVCLYKLYKCVHDRVRRFYTSAGQVTYGHGAFSSNSSTLLWETSKEREIQEHSLELRRRRQESVLVWRERDRERETETGTLGLHNFNTLLACILSVKTFSISFSAVGKRIGRAGALSQETLVMTRFVQKTRRLQDSGTLTILPAKGSIFFGSWGFLALCWFSGQPVSVLESAGFARPLGNWQQLALVEGELVGGGHCGGKGHR